MPSSRWPRTSSSVVSRRSLRAGRPCGSTPGAPKARGVGIRIDPTPPCASWGSPSEQMVEVAKAPAARPGADMDKPTSACTAPPDHVLFATVPGDRPGRWRLLHLFTARGGGDASVRARTFSANRARRTHAVGDVSLASSIRYGEAAELKDDPERRVGLAARRCCGRGAAGGVLPGRALSLIVARRRPGRSARCAARGRRHHRRDPPLSVPPAGRGRGRRRPQTRSAGASAPARGPARCRGLVLERSVKDASRSQRAAAVAFASDGIIDAEKKRSPRARRGPATATPEPGARSRAVRRKPAEGRARQIVAADVDVLVMDEPTRIDVAARSITRRSTG